MNQRVSLLLLIVAIVAAFNAIRPPGSSVAGQSTPAPAIADASFQWLGTASCAAAACHNSNGPRGSPSSEYTTWIAHDPHARAYQVLLNATSTRIVKNLKLKDANEEALCLNCHVHPHFVKSLHSASFTKADGVGCESCHGPARGWIAGHYRTGWQGLTAMQKAQRGMNDTRSIEGRAKTCVACHVGAPGGDVNHDLIAAGHPRLNFEFGAYHANLPRHWSDATDKDLQKGGRRDFEAQAWAVGQVVSAQAALDLLRERAKDERQPWPEFAEYDCYACHHGLAAESWRQQRDVDRVKENAKNLGSDLALRQRLAGTPPWGTWYFPMTAFLAERPSLQNANFLKEINGLDREMSHPYPERAVVLKRAEAAELALKALRGAVVNESFDAVQVRALFDRLGQKGPDRVGRNWDGAAQLYLGLAALHNAWSDVGPPPPVELKRELKALAEALAAPSRFAPIAFEKHLKNLRSFAR